MSTRTLPGLLRSVAAHAARRLPPQRAIEGRSPGTRSPADPAASIPDTDTLAALLGELDYEVEMQHVAAGETTCLIFLDAGATRHIVEAELSPGTSRLWLVAQIGPAALAQTASALLAQLLWQNVRIGPHFFGYRTRDQQLLLHACVENRDMTAGRLRGHLERLRKLIRDTRPIWAAVVRPIGEPIPAPAAGATAIQTPEKDGDTTWCLFTSPEGRFRVQLPQTPRIDKHTLVTEKGPVDLHVVSADQDSAGVSYGVCYSDLDAPAAAKGKNIADEVLARAREAVIQLMNGRVVEERPIALEGHPGLELMVHSWEKGTAVARVFCVGDRFFQVLAVGKGLSPWQPLVRSFLESFGLMRE